MDRLPDPQSGLQADGIDACGTPAGEYNDLWTNVHMFTKANGEITMNIAIITGASSGLGTEFVRAAAKRYKTLDMMLLYIVMNI